MNKNKEIKFKSKRILRLIIINLFVFFVLFELSSAIIIHVFKIGDPPYIHNVFKQKLHVVDIDTNFGVWHYPNFTISRKTQCYNVTYRFNSYGARDKERSKKQTAGRIAFLGDSFVEGFGLNDEERISNILENMLGIEVMNFGAFGDFGTTQIAKLYQNLAIQFDHDIILIGLFPFNDFDENNLEYGKKNFSKRYRPYRSLNSYGDYDLIYYQDELAKSEWYPDNIKTSYFIYLIPIIKMTHSGMLLRFLYRNIKYNSNSSLVQSRFKEFTDEELNILKYDLLEIKEFSRGKKIYIFAIPSQNDFIKYYSDPVGFNRLGVELKKFCEIEGLTYIDLFSELLSKHNKNTYFDLYLSCDPHFSALGSKESAEILFKYIKK